MVVGVDGSEGAAAALEFAAGEAAFREARLRIVSVWEVPVAAYAGGFAPPPAPEIWEAFQTGAQQIADEALASVKKLQPSLEAETIVVQGQPANALLVQAADAALIVVGRRGLGGFRSLLLGSVSQQVVQHASCPVVIVNQPATVS